jgi:Na+/proline symporter
MVADFVAVPVLVIVLGLFTLVGLRAEGSDDLDSFVAARGTQTGAALGWSLFASGLGAWVLFAPAEVGARVGLMGVAGYMVAVAAPLAVLALAGRRLRRLMPAGHSLTELVRARFARPVHGCVVAVSLAYMLVAVTAELTAAGAVMERLSGVDPRWAIVAIIVATLAYTASAGLRASLRTDGWQSWMLLALLAVTGIAVAVGSSDRLAVREAGSLWRVDASGVEAAATLVVAVVATTMFHNGYWQRVWAAADDTALARGAWLGVAVRVPVLALAGLSGVLAAAAGAALGDPPVPFFALLEGLPAIVGVVVLGLAVCLVASSVDTLQNGMASLVATERPRLGLRGARVATVALMAPAAAVAVEGFSVLRLLLLADLLCAAMLVPTLAALWRSATSAGVGGGIVAGLVGAIAPGWVTGGSLAAGLSAATLPDGLSLAPFAGGLGASSLVVVAGSLVDRARGHRSDVLDAAESMPWS